jgi:glycerol-3-phosphate dehydrogenase
MLDALRDTERVFDLLIIGGGATGLATALDAASRGYATALVERNDFAGGSSSRSTKLVHGGVRYLRQGHIRLVRESLRERSYLIHNAPHLVTSLPTVIPAYSRWARMKYSAGLIAYDLLTAGHGIGRTRLLGRDATVDALPGLEARRLSGGVLYFDGQTDDARMALALAHTAADNGAAVANYVSARELVKQAGRVAGAEVEDRLTGQSFRINAKAVVNATGVFTDELRVADSPDAPPVMRWSRGTHITLDGGLLPRGHGLLVPETADGRVIFALPWLGKTLVGTTDVPVDTPDADPEPPAEDVEFLLDELSRYLPDARHARVMAAFTGIRPLVETDRGAKTAEIARSHRVIVSESGLVTITGGKWTTSRLMAEHAVSRAAVVAGLERRACVTKSLPLRGADGAGRREGAVNNPDELYGSEMAVISGIESASIETRRRLAPSLPYRVSHILHAARDEMAVTVADALALRTRSLALDARAAADAAPRVAVAMAGELGKNAAWEREQVAQARAAARNFTAR